MTRIERGRLGWPVWTLFVLSLGAVLVNFWMILFGLWAWTDPRTGDPRAETVANVAFAVVIAVLAVAILSLVKRWRLAALILSALQFLPAIVIALGVIFIPA